MNTITVISIAIVGIMTSYAIFLVHKHKNILSNLSGIIIAMTLAAITALCSGYLIGALSGDLFLASGLGMMIGFFIGFLTGQPAGIIAILIGSTSGLISGIAAALFGVSLKAGNPFLMMIILLVFYLFILVFIILFILVESSDKFKLDTLAVSPFAILTAGVIFISLFLFLYSSDAVKVSNTQTSGQAQSDTSGTVIDVTRESAPTVNMEVTPTGYKPNVIRVKKGTPVKLVIHNPLTNSCLSTLEMPDFNLNKINLKVGTTQLRFTPTRAGDFTFTCGMNMYKGLIIVE